jgi:demethoxyubiquinone hydroxylase (CLK1/Coq7/Cat5 family)
MATQTESTLNCLLRGEIAATETYQQALSKVGDEPGAEEIRRLHREHREAANTLRQHVHDHSATPSHDSGFGGTFAKAIEGLAKLFGDRSAVCTLREGEKQGINHYKDALNDPEVAEDCKTLIRSHLLPQTEEHVKTLDRIIEKL